MRNKKTAPAAVTPDAIAAIVMERNDLRRRLDEVKSRAAETDRELKGAIERSVRLRAAIAERDVLILHLRGQIEQIKFAAEMMKASGFDLTKKLGDALFGMTGATTRAADVATKIAAGIESEPALTTKV